MFRPGLGFGQRYHVDRHGQLTLKQLGLSVLNEMHTNSYTGPRLFNGEEKRNKLTANFKNEPYTVTSKNNCEITATNKHNHTVRRNVSHWKLIPRATRSEDGNESDDSEESIHSYKYMLFHGDVHLTIIKYSKN